MNTTRSGYVLAKRRRRDMCIAMQTRPKSSSVRSDMFIDSNANIPPAPLGAAFGE